MILFNLPSERMNYYENIQTFINVSKAVPPGGQHFVSYDRPFITESALTRRVILRVECIPNLNETKLGNDVFLEIYIFLDRRCIRCLFYSRSVVLLTEGQ